MKYARPTRLSESDGGQASHFVGKFHGINKDKIVLQDLIENTQVPHLIF